MRCPLDGGRLVEIDRAGVLIDACPDCRGIWLDRGELDKILERAAAPGPAGQARPAEPGPLDRQLGGRGWDDDDDDDRSRRGDPVGGRRRKRSFLDDIFDFG